MMVLNRSDRRKLKRAKMTATQTDRIYVPLTPAEAALSKANNEPLPYAIQYKMITTLREYVDDLRNGKMNRTQYMRLAIMNYATASAANRVAHMDGTGQILRMGKQLEGTEEALRRIGEHGKEVGKFIASGNDLREVLHSVDFTADILGLVPGHVMHEACKEANARAQQSEHRAMQNLK